MSSLSRNSTIMLAGVSLAAIGAATLYATHLLPLANGTTAGTIMPAVRYHASQVSNKDINLGDTGVAQLMQTDGFELMVKNPSFRALATNPGFMALAMNPAALAALQSNPQALPRRRPRWLPHSLPPVRKPR